MAWKHGKQKRLNEDERDKATTATITKQSLGMQTSFMTCNSKTKHLTNAGEYGTTTIDCDILDDRGKAHAIIAIAE